jgi:hypothetical protein
VAAPETATGRRRLNRVVIPIMLLVAIAAVFVGMWKLPELFVDEGSLVKFNGDRDGVAIQAAYNAARVPIGVVLASLLAAAAAAAGVITTRRTIAVTQAGVDLTREGLQSTEAQHQRDREDALARDERDRLQWREEQLSKRFQEAAAQLGNTEAAVRLAGVYALGRLADDWEEQRQVCVDVLCSYLRITKPSDDRGEEQVCIAIQAVLKRGLEARESGERPWPNMRLDLSGTRLRDFSLRDFAVQQFSLAKADLIGVCEISGQSMERADFNGVTIWGIASVEGAGLLGVHMKDIKFKGSGYSTWSFQPRREDIRPGQRFAMHNLAGLAIMSGNVTLDLEGYKDFPIRGRLNLNGVHVSAGALLEVSSLDEETTGRINAMISVANADVQGTLQIEDGLKRSPSVQAPDERATPTN